jgi:hypothetical protein
MAPDRFLPSTVHIHDGHSVPPVADFDHELFFQSAREPEMKGDWFTSSAPVRTLMRMTSLPSRLMDLNEPCSTIELRGLHANRDVYLVVDKDGRVKEAS